MSSFTVTPTMADDIARTRADGANWSQVAKPYGVPWQAVRAGYQAALRDIPTPAADRLLAERKEAPASAEPVILRFPNFPPIVGVGPVIVGIEAPPPVRTVRVRAAQPRRTSRAQRRAGR